MEIPYVFHIAYKKTITTSKMVTNNQKSWNSMIKMILLEKIMVKCAEAVHC